jgi:hypothetical protein
MRVLALGLLLLASTVRAADPPSDVVEFFRSVTQALADAHTQSALLPNNAAGFLRNFDSAMPRYADLRAEIEDLVARGTISNAAEFVTDDGDENKRTLQIDWLLEIENQRPRREILKCTIERRDKGKWKITALAPVEFFKY